MDVRISNIEIENYRSCHRAQTVLEPDLSVLIGPNGSGKTNLLTAIMLLKKLVDFEERFRRIEEQSTVISTLKVTFVYGKKSITLEAIISIYSDQSNADVIVHTRQMWDLRDFGATEKRPHIPLSALGVLKYKEPDFQKSARDIYAHRYMQAAGLDKYPKTCKTALYAIYEFVQGIKYYGASQFTDPSSNPVAFEIEEEGSRSIGLRMREKTSILLDMYNADRAKNHSLYDQFKSIIGKDGVKVVDDINFDEIKTSSVDYTVRSGGKIRTRRRNKKLIIPQFYKGKQTLSPNQLSEGSFRTIALLFYLITDKSKLLLLEEPEVCIHHGLLTSVIELIKTYARKKQIIMSTHSDFVLDQTKPRNVFKVTLTNRGGTQIKHLTDSLSTKEMDALKHYLSTEGNLGEYWRHGRLE